MGGGVGGGGRPTHDCGLVSTRSECPRAVRVYMRAGSALKGRCVGGGVVGVRGSFGSTREICKCKCDSAILGWVCARLTSPSTKVALASCRATGHHLSHLSI